MVNGSDMEIIELIERIAQGDRRQDTFYFVMEDTNARQTAYVVNYEGKPVSSCAYSGIEVTSHYT